MTTYNTVMKALQTQMSSVAADPKRIFQGRAVAYISGKMIYLAGASIRYNLMMGRKTPIAFFEPPKPAAASKIKIIS